MELNSLSVYSKRAICLHSKISLNLVSQNRVKKDKTLSKTLKKNCKRRVIKIILESLILKFKWFFVVTRLLILALTLTLNSKERSDFISQSVELKQNDKETEYQSHDLWIK